MRNGRTANQTSRDTGAPYEPSLSYKQATQAISMLGIKKANMYLIPAGLLAKHAGLTEHAALLWNLIPVTLGNIVGGICILMLHPNRIRQLMVLTKGKEL